MTVEEWKAFKTAMKTYYVKNGIKNKTLAGIKKWNAAITHTFILEPLPKYRTVYDKRSELSDILTAAVNILMTNAVKDKSKHQAFWAAIFHSLTT